MPAGVQIWDEAGRLILDTTDSVGRVIALIYITGAGSYSNNELTKGDIFVHFSPSNYAQVDTPLFNFSGNTLSWSQDGAKAFGGNLLIGTR